MALTDKEKEQIKNKFNKYVDTMSNALDVNETEVKKIISKHNTNGTLSKIYADYSKKKDKFKGGVPGGFFSISLNVLDFLVLSTTFLPNFLIAFCAPFVKINLDTTTTPAIKGAAIMLFSFFLSL